MASMPDTNVRTGEKPESEMTSEGIIAPQSKRFRDENLNQIRENGNHRQQQNHHDRGHGQPRENRGRHNGRNRGQRGSSGNANRNGGHRNDDYNVYQKLRIISGPTHDLTEMKDSMEEVKFSGRNRLFVGNLPADLMNEAQIRELFKPYGEVDDIFISGDKNFGFLKVDYRANAVKAKRSLDGTLINGRQFRVRFAQSQSGIRVSNLSPVVTNELLYKAFEPFGAVERAIVSVDDRGNSLGEGIVEFVNKSSANTCLRMCSERCYFLTASMRPCIVELLDVKDTDGLPEKSLPKNDEYGRERSIGPRFAETDSFEHEMGSKWKHVVGEWKRKEESLKVEYKLEMEKLAIEIEKIHYMHEAERKRQELQRRQEGIERRMLEWDRSQRYFNSDNAPMFDMFHQPETRNFVHPEPGSFGFEADHTRFPEYVNRSDDFNRIFNYDGQEPHMNSTAFDVFGENNTGENQEFPNSENHRHLSIQQNQNYADNMNNPNPLMDILSTENISPIPNEDCNNIWQRRSDC